MTHINPGTDTTINPVIINDTHRSARAKPKCSLAVKHTTVLKSVWIGCKKVVGECKWIQEHGKCPKQEEFDDTCSTPFG